MKSFQFRLLLLAGTALVAASCLERTFSEEEGSIATRTAEITVPCDMYEGRNLVKDTIFVTSNRSWSAAIVEDGVDWMTLAIPGHQDMSRVSEVTPLAISFLDNETEEARSATVHITCADGDRDITVTQEAITYRMEVLSDLSVFDGVNSEGDTLKLKINSNTSWSAKIASGATADVRFSTKAREIDATASLDSKYSRTIDVVVGENDDLTAKDALIVLSATGCEDIEIPVAQLAGRPYLRFTGADGDTYAAEPGRANCTIPMKTNVSWTAEIVSCEGWADGEVSVKASGSRGAQDVAVTFPYCIDFDNPGKIVIRFTGEGLDETVDYTITQRPCIRIMWYDYLNSKLLGASSSTYPFTTPVFSDIKTSSSNVPAKLKGTEIPCVTKRGAFTFIIYSTPGIWRNGSQGFLFGSAVNDYMRLPVIEGHRLVSIFYGRGCTRTASGNVNYQVRDSSGNPVEGGAITSSVDTTAPVMHTIELSGTVVGEEYRIVNLGTANFGVGDLILYYE